MQRITTLLFLLFRHQLFATASSLSLTRAGVPPIAGSARGGAGSSLRARGAPSPPASSSRSCASAATSCAGDGRPGSRSWRALSACPPPLPSAACRRRRKRRGPPSSASPRGSAAASPCPERGRPRPASRFAAGRTLPRPAAPSAAQAAALGS
uniref:Uncharacterized protein n=1 Tax=Arundo donax TaxID=35708 RepID=A0A0A9GIL0_ARUDO